MRHGVPSCLRVTTILCQHVTGFSLLMPHHVVGPHKLADASVLGLWPRCGKRVALPMDLSGSQQGDLPCMAVGGVGMC
jgi:hypothetical protein